MDDFALRTPLTHPDHHTVGRFFRLGGVELYYCDSYDPACGFWMTNVDDPVQRRNVSERAIGRTYHEFGLTPARNTPQFVIIERGSSVSVLCKIGDRLPKLKRITVEQWSEIQHYDDSTLELFLTDTC